MEASGDINHWLSLDQSGVFGLDKSLQQVSSKVLPPEESWLIPHTTRGELVHLNRKNKLELSWGSVQAETVILQFQV